ncbi:MAG: deoxyribodipyrimidine photo-lyase [Nitrospira sp. CR1.1]|jgi:deoxyribodipyrimidine photo-lyase|nr:deoxyribodipyrimidine photo-lyase [Nitrospira sp. CR1.1]
MKGLVWFRRDLRLHDNPALSAACKECTEIVPLFVFDEPLLRGHVFGSVCVGFMLGCLEELRRSLAKQGVTLVWRRGESIDTVLRAVHECAVDAVYWNRDYEPSAVARDRTVQQRLVQEGRLVKTFKDHVVFEAEEVRGLTGDPFQRYSAYRDRWWTQWRSATPPLLPVPSFPSPSPAPEVSIWPTAQDLGYQTVPMWIEPGEQAARARLQWFLKGPVHSYVSGRNLPAQDGTSKLSPHLRFGTISTRTMVHAALRTLSKGGQVSRPDVFTWMDELVWREFFQQVLMAFPHVAEGPFKVKPALPAPRPAGPERDRLFAAWCEGRTGYPIVDAGMRQLNQTGWMHNRVRMVVASFLVKDLRVDWQSGERYFLQHLVDGDLAANNGNWQWCASTGTDAMQGYRIFNPTLQSEKFDPEGGYIRRYVPELSSVPAAWIHEPQLMPQEEQIRVACRIGSDYPEPIVNHRQARQEYLDLGKQKVST